MPVTWLSNQGFLARQITAVQAWANAAVDSSVGSITLAWAQACSAVALWLQAEVVQTLALTRASTSFGADLDSWMAQWNFARQGGAAAAGNVIVGRFTAASRLTIPVTARFSTGPGGQTFTVQPDPLNTAYSAIGNGYTLMAGVGSMVLPVLADVAGSGGNVAANTITSFLTPVLGIDTVSNPTALAGGIDAMLDTVYLAQFPFYIASLARGTEAAIAYAASSVQIGLMINIQENVDGSGAVRPGYFVVVVDDGTGSPPAPLLYAVAAAVDGYRAIGTFPIIRAPATTFVAIVAILQYDSDLNRPGAIAAATAAITTLLATLPIRATLQYLRLAQVVLDSSSHIRSISSLLVANQSLDVVPSQFGAIRLASLSVT